MWWATWPREAPLPWSQPPCSANLKWLAASSNRAPCRTCQRYELFRQPAYFVARKPHSMLIHPHLGSLCVGICTQVQWLRHFYSWRLTTLFQASSFSSSYLNLTDTCIVLVDASWDITQLQLVPAGPCSDVPRQQLLGGMVGNLWSLGVSSMAFMHVITVYMHVITELKVVEFSILSSFILQSFIASMHTCNFVFYTKLLPGAQTCVHHLTELKSIVKHPVSTASYIHTISHKLTLNTGLWATCQSPNPRRLKKTSSWFCARAALCCCSSSMSTHEG